MEDAKDLLENGLPQVVARAQGQLLIDFKVLRGGLFFNNYSLNIHIFGLQKHVVLFIFTVK